VNPRCCHATKIGWKQYAPIAAISEQQIFIDGSEMGYGMRDTARGLHQSNTVTPIALEKNFPTTAGE